MNLLTGRVRGDEVVLGSARDGSDAAVLPVSESARGRVAEGEEVVYGVRPEYLDHAHTTTEDDAVKGAFMGKVAVVENLGSTSLVTLDIGGSLVHVVVGEGREPRVGDSGHAMPRADRALLYKDGGLIAEGDTATATVAGR